MQKGFWNPVAAKPRGKPKSKNFQKKAIYLMAKLHLKNQNVKVIK